MRVGISHHLGWAVAVTATDDTAVFDRRRIDLVEPDLPAAPIHHEGGPYAMHRSGDPLDDDALGALVAEVRASVERTTEAALDELEVIAPEPIVSMSLQAWPQDFPESIAVQRRVPYESRADSVMYRQVLAEAGADRGWAIHLYTRDVEAEAVRVLGTRARDVLHGPRTRLGPPWSKDHRVALAAIVMSRSL